ncbi:ComC/BlpC family leader-containing pheromone/bacteriocin [Limibacterium fermenti]|jgi:hypothetical protein|nr:hypothetical protein [Porphyromonadaceae bacterium]HBX46349.1 hypothetical protein [Porphyromonadaceae bacterium]
MKKNESFNSFQAIEITELEQINGGSIVETIKFLIEVIKNPLTPWL